MRGTKHGPSWTRRDISVSDGEGHSLWIKLWGPLVALADNLAVGAEISVKNVVVNVFNDLTSVGSTDLTEIKVFFFYLLSYLSVIVYVQISWLTL
jgi:hypothetical protein